MLLYSTENLNETFLSGLSETKISHEQQAESKKTCLFQCFKEKLLPHRTYFIDLTFLCRNSTARLIMLAQVIAPSCLQLQSSAE